MLPVKRSSSSYNNFKKLFQNKQPQFSEEEPTQAQIDLVRMSWERVSELRHETDDRNISPSHAFGLAFYSALFDLNPECKELFTNVFQQARALTGMISYIARAPKAITQTNATIRDMNAKNTTLGEADPEHLALKMQELGARHYFYNVQPYHFNLVGPAFVTALKQRLRDEYREEIGEAWVKANAYAAYNMKIGYEAQRVWEEEDTSKKIIKAACTIQ